MLPSRPFKALIFSLPLIATLPACKPDRDLTPTSSATGTGGAGGSGGATTTTGQGGDTTTGSTTTPEPPGETKLTIVNGVNDFDAIRVCFLPYPDGPSVTPWPASSNGLGFARSALISPPTAIAPGGGDVQPFLIGGDLSLTVGLSCAEILALAETQSGSGGAGGAGGTGGGGGAGGAPPDQPSIVVSPMPVIPSSVFDTDKSLLLVFYGCMAKGHTDGTEGLGCGFAYKPDSPTVGLGLVGMSRITEPDKIGIQMMHATPSLQTSDIRITPGFDNAIDVPVAKSLALGGLGPKPPFLSLSRGDLGLLSKVTLKTFAPNDTFATSTIALNDTFANGEIQDTVFKDGSNFTFVAVGGYPGVITQSFWHPFTYVAVRSDP